MRLVHILMQCPTFALLRCAGTAHAGMRFSTRTMGCDQAASRFEPCIALERDSGPHFHWKQRKIGPGARRQVAAS